MGLSSLRNRRKCVRSHSCSLSLTHTQHTQCNPGQLVFFKSPCPQYSVIEPKWAEVGSHLNVLGQWVFLLLFLDLQPQAGQVCFHLQVIWTDLNIPNPSWASGSLGYVLLKVTVQTPETKSNYVSRDRGREGDVSQRLSSCLACARPWDDAQHQKNPQSQNKRTSGTLGAQGRLCS